ncbi:MAG: hypothetical protein EBU97_03460 [Rhodobacteraceae bacterium]|nr:hypothetical protein [Paracoccaceae bacterium]
MRAIKAAGAIWQRLRALICSYGPVYALIDDDELLVRWLPGQGPRLVVVVSGFRAPNERKRRLEFAKLASKARNNHVLFVTDLTYGWYSRPGMLGRIEQFISEFAANHGLTDIVTLGESMGGYGAIALARNLPVSHVAAFAPQILMTDDIISQKAWDPYRAGFNLDHLMRDLRPILAARTSRVSIVIGDQFPNDILQRHSLRGLEDAIQLTVLPGVGHLCPRFLKGAGLLPDMVAAMLGDRGHDLTEISKRAVAAAQHALTKTRQANQNNRLADAGELIHDQI